MKGYCKQGSFCQYAHAVPLVPAGASDGAAAPVAAAVPRVEASVVAKQQEYGAQSCRGLKGGPDLSPLGGHVHGEKVFREMLARERALCGEWVAFYHSYNSPALVYEVQAAIAGVLFNFSARHGCLPRLLKAPFADLPDAPAMLKAFPTWADRDLNPAFKSVGICVTTSLVSPDPEATPTNVFLTGYAASSISISVLEKLLRDCGAGLSGCNVKELAKKVMGLAKKHGFPQAIGSAFQGHMLQIFLRRTCVDKWAYASLPYGVPDTERQPLSKHLAKPGLICGQARLAVNPSAFMRASSVRLYTSSADENFHRNRRSFQQELERLLSPILGCQEVRERAAAGIYGGKLPSWWRDLQAESAADTGSPAKGDDASTSSSLLDPKAGGA